MRWCRCGATATRSHPVFVGAHVQVRWQHGTDIARFHAGRTLIVEHRLAPRCAQGTAKLPEHTAALENVVLAQLSDAWPCRRKINRPPSDTALALAVELIGDRVADPVIDLDVYRRLTEGDAS